MGVEPYKDVAHLTMRDDRTLTVNKEDVILKSKVDYFVLYYVKISEVTVVIIVQVSHGDLNQKPFHYSEI